MATVDTEFVARVLHAGWGSRVVPSRIESISAGLSGNPAWRINASAGEYVLRRWPGSPDVEQRLRPHRLLRELANSPGHVTPTPQLTRTGQNSWHVDHDGHWWELLTWLPGEADWQARPSQVRLCAACEALGQLHGRLKSVRESIAATDELARRRARLGQLTSATDWPAAASDLPLADFAVAAQLAAERCAQVPWCPPRQQWCWGDAWHENVLFSAVQVSGLIDWGSPVVDSPERDLARLLGGMAAERDDWWELGIAAYAAAAGAPDRQRLVAYDASGVVLSLANWLNWRFRDRLSFSQTLAASERIDHLARQAMRLARDWQA